MLDRRLKVERLVFGRLCGRGEPPKFTYTLKLKISQVVAVAYAGKIPGGQGFGRPRRGPENFRKFAKKFS